MALERLDASQAWTAGADLWVISREESSLLSRIDWLLNFQISKAQHHKSPLLADRVQEILKLSGLTSASNFGSNQLLISSVQFLPTKWVLLLDEVSDAQNIDDWTHGILKTWQALGMPSLRMFLPKAFNFDKFQKSWKKSIPLDTDVTVVVALTLVETEAS